MSAPNLQNPCQTCGAKSGEPCRVTDPRTAESDKWREYRALNPHPSREYMRKLTTKPASAGSPVPR
jgi:hypothetical protein